MSPNEDPATLPYRVRELERHQDELRTQTVPELLSTGRAWHSSLMTKIAEIDRQLVQLDRRLDERFAPRREAEQRHSVVNEQIVSLERVLRANREEEREWIKDNKERIDRLEKALWGIAIGLVMTFIASTLAWLRAGAPH